MTLQTFIEMAMETYYDCYIWDYEKQERVFEGTLDDIPEELLEREFSSFEIDGGKIGLNIN